MADFARFIQIFKHVIQNPNENEARNALGRLRAAFEATGIPIEKLKITDGKDSLSNANSLILSLQKDRVALRREVDFLRRHVTPTFLAKSMQARDIEYVWGTIEDIATEKLADENGRLPKGWQRTIQDILGVSTGQMRRFKEGTETVSNEKLEKLLNLPPGPAASKTREEQEKRQEREAQMAAKANDASRRGQRDAHYPWEKNFQIEVMVVENFLAGLSQNENARKVGWLPDQPHNAFPNPQQVLNRTWNQRPPKFLGAKVQNTGPLSWLEFWLIGSTIYGGNGNSAKGWYKRSMARIGLDERKYRFGTGRITAADPTMVAAFRSAYAEGRGTDKTKRHIVELMAEAGPRGMTDKELQERVGDKGSNYRSRRGELVAMRYLKDSGKKRGKGASAETVWVSIPEATLTRFDMEILGIEMNHQPERRHEAMEAAE